eukprot:TRINITY_DN67362_c7_g2_i1.p1 TRINITY_DN67362_c7_g2~~TRINITY_DN67362_c7_g2_i1.p1  ORF type:complete len:395 (-),score=20.95 TRINITY_DN67362_c7_g2_i1:238-1422(-)
MDGILVKMGSTISQALEIGVIPLAALAAFVIVSFIAMGMTGFGPAIIFHIGWQLLTQIWPVLSSASAHDTNDVIDAVMLLAVNAPFSILPLYYTSKKDVRWDLFWWLFIPKTTCFVLGTEVLVKMPPQRMKEMLAVVFILFALFLLGRELNRLGLGVWLRARDGSKFLQNLGKKMETLWPVEGGDTEVLVLDRTLKAGAALCGAASGLLNGMFGTPGPPLLIFFAFINTNASVVRGTSTACHFWNLPIRMLYFFGVKQRFDSSKLAHMVIVIVFGQIGLRIGDRMHETVSQTTSQWFMLALLFGACCLMLEYPLWISLPVFIALFTFVGVISHYEKKIKAYLGGKEIDTDDEEAGLIDEPTATAADTPPKVRLVSPKDRHHHPKQPGPKLPGPK